MKIIAWAKSHPVITVVIILFTIAVLYYVYVKKNGIVVPFGPETDTPPAPSTTAGPDIQWNVQSISGKSINYTISAGGNTVTGTASTERIGRNIENSPLAGGYYYSVVSDRPTGKITMTISHVENEPNIHFVVDKSAVAQF